MKMPSPRLWIAAALLAAGCALVGSGFLIRHKIHDQAELEFDLGAFGLTDLPAFTTISEKDLLVDATFTGVVKKEGGLYSTYDRTQSRGKRACPS